MRWVVYILNLEVKDGLAELSNSIVKIRTLVKFVRSSPSRLQKFKECALEEKLDTKRLVHLDVETRWNSTYLMFDSAIKFKKAFCCMLVKEPLLQREMTKVGGDITNDEWREASYFLPYLKIFYDATLKMSASLYAPSNSYVEVIFGVGEVLSQYTKSDDKEVSKMATQMKVKYDKYWGNIDKLNLLLFVSLILDPRWKCVYVEWMVKKTYGLVNGSVLARNIKYFLQELFDFYASSVDPKEGTPSSSSSSTSVSLLSKEKKQDDMFNLGALLGKKFEEETGGGELKRKPELDKYLEDARESTETSFKILQWWKDNQKRYPILSMMARDVIAIPVSTVASESTFSTGGRILDSFRTSLSPSMVEALICAQNWLRSSSKLLIIKESLLEMEKLQEGKEDLVLEQPVIAIDDSHDVMIEVFKIGSGEGLKAK